MDNFYNIPNSKLKGISYYDSRKLLQEFLIMCELSEIEPEKICSITDVENLSCENKKNMVSYITIYSNILDIYDDAQLASIWMTVSQKQSPFNYRSPLEVIQQEVNGLMQVRVFTNALKFHLAEIIGNEE